MQTEDTEFLAPENFTVARIRRTVLGSLDLGGIFINRQSTDGPSGYNRSWGVDANARLLGNMITHLYLAETYDSDPVEGSGDNRAAKVMLGWRDALIDASALYRTIGDYFKLRLASFDGVGLSTTTARSESILAPACRECVRSIRIWRLSTLPISTGCSRPETSSGG